MNKKKIEKLIFQINTDTLIETDLPYGTRIARAEALLKVMEKINEIIERLNTK